MSWPTIITLTANRFAGVGAQGTPTPAAGTFTFVASHSLSDGATGIIQPLLIIATLVAGVLSQALPATNDPTTVESGVTYTVTEFITGVPSRSYSIVVPYNSPGATLDLDSLPQAQ